MWISLCPAPRWREVQCFENEKPRILPFDNEGRTRPDTACSPHYEVSFLPPSAHLSLPDCQSAYPSTASLPQDRVDSGWAHHGKKKMFITRSEMVLKRPKFFFFDKLSSHEYVGLILDTYQLILNAMLLALPKQIMKSRIRGCKIFDIDCVISGMPRQAKISIC